jgi:hypothetical protein
VGGRAKSIQEKGGLHESRRLQGFPSDASQKRSRVIYSGLGISIFMKAYVNLTRNLHGRSFCWRKIMRKHRGIL